jgi:hypothetical protein
MTTVHLEPSRKWLPAIKEQIAALEKLSDEWHAKETEIQAEAKKLDNESMDKYQAHKRANAIARAEYDALSWWGRRGKPNPWFAYDHYPLRFWHVRRPYPMAPMIAALHSLVLPAKHNLPLDVDAEIAALFIK